jgi:FixJ family two-component response regulator
MSKHRNLVLVVDDDPGMLRAVQRLLRQHAYEPIVFSSARAFKSHTDFEKAVCVILDINLNDGSGIELRHGLKAAGVSVPIIYVTGNESPAVREAALGCWMRRVSNPPHKHTAFAASKLAYELHENPEFVA